MVHGKLEARVQVPVQDRIFLFQFYNQTKDGFVLKIKFSNFQLKNSCSDLSQDRTKTHFISNTYSD